MQKTILPIAVALLTVASGAAFAQGGMGQGWVMRNCEAEVGRYCANLKHGSGEIPACLAKHRKDLSPACKAALDNKGPGWGRTNQQPAPVQ